MSLYLYLYIATLPSINIDVNFNLQNQQDSPGASRQVSFSGGRETSGIAAGIRQAVAASYGAAAPAAASAGAGGTDSSLPPPAARGEPVSLATLNRDCFIIPVASLDRFLPAGVPVSPFFLLNEIANLD